MTHFSRLGFILSLAGSAIGLGNIWKFPYVAGASGGGAFIFIFMISVVFVLLSAFMAEMILGRESTSNPVDTFEKLSATHNSAWKYVGFMIISGLLVLAFYSMVLGWILYYTVYLLFSIPSTGEEAGAIFKNFTQYEVGYQLLGHFLIMLICGLILVRGIKNGIEKLNLILMPTLFVIFFALFIYSLTLQSFNDAFVFMFDFRWSQVTSHTILEALGQAFFSMSIGVGTIIAYSGSMPRHINFVRSSAYIAILNTGLAIVAGLVVFSLLFEYQMQPNGGPGLIFISLPIVFSKMGLMGHAIAFIFLIALLFAGVTSAVSLAEPTIAYLVERHGHTRSKATWYVICFCFLLGSCVIFDGSVYFDLAAYLGGMSLFDWLDKLTSTIMMPLAGIVICLFVGFALPQERVFQMFHGYVSGSFFKIWLILIRFVAPIAIAIIMMQGFLDSFFGFDLATFMVGNMQYVLAKLFGFDLDTSMIGS